MSREDLIAAFKRWDAPDNGIIRAKDLAEVMRSIGISEDEVDKVLKCICTQEEVPYSNFVDWLCFPAACRSESKSTRRSTRPSCKRFVGANWKCSLESVVEVDKLISDMNAFWQANGDKMSELEICVFPPYVFLDRVRQQLHPEICVGSQNAWDAAPGFKSTGVVTAEMLHAVGCRWVLLGHSDRRNSLGETDSLIHDKVDKCLEGGLSVNLTIGETLEARNEGKAIETLIGQLSAAVANVPENAWNQIAIAYEPVWAIGEGATPCSPEETQSVLSSLRSWISENKGEACARACRLLYTGSVNEKNAKEYASLADVDGFVVGRAGLDVAKLATICTSFE
jgi:triosephosphate isomerase